MLDLSRHDVRPGSRRKQRKHSQVASLRATTGQHHVGSMRSDCIRYLLARALEQRSAPSAFRMHTARVGPTFAELEQRLVYAQVDRRRSVVI
jgi:hypothetical protein